MDMVIHYHVDWAKMNINKKYGWKADTHEAFWILLGLDQLAHAATYVWLVSLVTT
jgi:ribulose 1,5-bisphosphate carboxylase large subunit-like protein